MVSTISETSDTETTTRNRSRIVVCWQHPEVRSISPVGLLSYDGQRYEFRYLASASTVPDFQPLLGFRDFDRTYESEVLFPLFAQRVMDPRRPDYSRLLSELAIEPGEDAPWELLTRTQGKREGDTLMMFPVPREHETGWTCQFLVHGIRHLARKTVKVHGHDRGGYSSERLEGLLRDLSVGESLTLEPEPTNEWNPEALLVLQQDNEPLGYLPDLLTKVVNDVRAESDVAVTVTRVNEAKAGWHMRVLAKLEVTGADPLRFLETIDSSTAS